MQSLLYFLLALPLPLLLLFLLQNHKRRASNALPPGPRGLPFIGNLLQLDPSAPHRHLWQLSQTYGPLTSLKLDRARVVVVSTAKMAEQVMKTHDLTFCSRPTTVGLQKLSYNGRDLAFAPYDACFREMKKLSMVHLFSLSRVQSFRPVREHEVAKMIEKISRSSLESRPFNLSEAMMSLTSTIICQVAFGKREFDAFYQEIIDEHLDPSRGKQEQDDIMDVLLQIWKGGSSKVQLSLDHIKALLMNIFVGGTDTSAAAVIWSMTYLMKNPKSMGKAQKEVRLAIGKKGFVNEEDIQQLPYLKAVVKETLRLQPSAPLLIPRESTQDCILGGYEIPAKTVIHVNAWAIGRDPEAWGENPEEFKPERFFMGKSIDVKGADFELIPFGAGRRICPAMHMALANVELSLANLLYAFDWGMPIGMTSDDLDMDVLPGLTMHKKTALCLVATEFVK
ncbi:unnamed protein product [Linum tenue]|uniref:Cytochrome P450 n=1 Tax=Linum tenue TaxID=586396 RepID=A0AAV0LMQ5_9ROSI|nr:unnamed protein product [Linum tenue]